MPSKVSKRGISRYRASVTVQGQTLQKLFPDESKKSYQAALVWEKETKKELEQKLSQTSSASLAIGQWSNEYLTEAENRFVKDTFKEKKGGICHVLSRIPGFSVNFRFMTLRSRSAETFC